MSDAWQCAIPKAYRGRIFDFCLSFCVTWVTWLWTWQKRQLRGVDRQSRMGLIFYHNSCISWWIFTLFVPMETGKNSVRCNYLTDWWHHNCVTVSCSLLTLASYFMHNNTTLKWNMLSSEHKILIETCGNLKDFLPEDSSKISLT